MTPFGHNTPGSHDLVNTIVNQGCSTGDNFALPPPPGDTWQCLEAFWSSQLGDGATGIEWAEVGDATQDGPPQDQE